MSMNLTGDGNLDGRITIQKGQGISQAIAGELGLSEDDCLKLGSVWTEIVAIAKKEDAFISENKYNPDVCLEVGDVFELDKTKLNEIIKLVNEKLDKNIKEFTIASEEESDTSDVSDGKKDINEDEENESIAREAGLSRDKLDSVLLRNTGIVTVAAIWAAVKNPNLRAQILPHLSPEQQKALKEAGKKFDKAKAAKAKVKNNIKDGVKGAREGKSELKNLEATEKKVAEYKNAMEEVNKKIDAETKALKNNPQYQQLKTDFDKVSKEIDKLEKRKLKNKTGKLSAQNEAKLTELKQKKADLLKQKQAFEKNLTAAKQQRTRINENLKQAQINRNYADALKKLDDAEIKKKAEWEKLKNNPEYKDVRSKLNKLKKLEEKVAKGETLTSSEATALKDLKKQKASLTKKLGKLTKDYNTANAEFKTAKAEVRKIKSPVMSKIKKGRNKVKLNLKKVPKAYLDTWKASIGKLSKTAKAGGTVLKGLGKIAKPILIVTSACDIYGAYKSGGTEKAVRQTAKLGTSIGGAWAGAKIGAGIGAAVGSAIPVVGTAVGGFVGGLVGGFAGWWAGEQVYDTAESIVLPPGTPPLDEEAAQKGEIELELTEEELSQLLKEYPDMEEAIEFVE